MRAGAPIRRLFMTADAVGGVWTFALELAAGLVRHGVATRLAVLGPAPSAAQEQQAAAIPGLELVASGLELEWRDRRGLADAQAAAAQLVALAREHRADIVHVNGFREASYGWEAPVVLTAHSCVHSWWRACRGEAPPAEWAAYRAGVQAGLGAADAVVAPSAAFLCELELLYGPLGRGRLIHNGCDLAVPTVRRKRFILAAGRLWDEAKNIAALAAIAPRLPWPVAIAGEMTPDAAYAGLIHLGRLEAAGLAWAMAEAEIFCAPARYEPFGLAVLEAARCGAALVLSTAPALIELWGDAARFVDPDDLEGLAGTLIDLIEDPVARAELQAAARARAARFTRARMTRAYYELYTELAAARHTRPERAA